MDRAPRPGNPAEGWLSKLDDMRHLPVLPSGAGTDVLPFDLDTLELKTPCKVSWTSMAGDNRVRYCGHCRQNVYNIESLSRAEAVRLITAREGGMCVRFRRRQDGTVVTADCWSRLKAARRKGLLAFAALLLFVGAAQVVAMFIGLGALKWMVVGPPPVSAGNPLPTGDAPWAKELARGGLRARGEAAAQRLLRRGRRGPPVDEETETYPGGI